MATSSKAVIPLLVGFMLLTGVCNTLLTKYQDMQCVQSCTSSTPRSRRNFEQPVWQTAQMFVGEAGCWLVVLVSALYNRFLRISSTRGEYAPIGVQRSSIDGETEDETTAASIAKPLDPPHPERRPLRGWRIILLALPATCDIIATTLMNLGLLYVAASIYQMTRGALVLFVGLFSVVFLGSRLAAYKWLSLFIVVAGVAVVGLAGIVEQRSHTLPGDINVPPKHALFKGADALRKSAIANAAAADAAATEPKDAALQTAIGISLIFLAQLFTASQFVLEESIMHRFTLTPLAVVGWEGTFGLLLTLLLMAVLHVTIGVTPEGRGGMFDARSGWEQMTSNPAIGYTSLLIMVSIGGFNFFGLSVTRSVSATSRSTIDTCRTLFIWVVSLGLGWESFKWLQVLGFAGLVYGTFLFNDIVRAPNVRCLRRGRGGPLLQDRPPLLAES